MLRSCNHIQKLELVDCGLDCEALLKICEGLRDNTSLTHLDLRHNIFDLGGLQGLIKALSEHMSLKNLLLESMPIGIKEANQLAKFFERDDCLIEEFELNEAEVEVEVMNKIL